MIEKGLHKFAKGMFAIFTIKLLLLGVVTLNQACQKDDNHNLLIDSQKEKVLKKFENSLKNIAPKTNKITSNFFKKKSSYKTLQAKGIIDESNIIEILDNLESKTEIEVKNLLYPLVDDSQELLLSYGITENDLKEIFYEIGILDINDPSLIIISEMILAIEKENKTLAFNHNNLLGLSAFAYQQQPNIYDCALRSIGVTAVIEAFEKGIHGAVGKALLKKAIRKVAVKALGWVGAVVAVYEFGNCMNWWYSASDDQSNDIISCDDLLIVQTKSYSREYLITKESINYKSKDDYKIPGLLQLSTYDVEFSSDITDRPVTEEELDCVVQKNINTIISSSIDINSIREFNK